MKGANRYPRKDRIRSESGALPLYMQLHSVLRDRLRMGLWRVGDNLPTIAELMAEFRVSRITVRQALALLEREGIIHTRRAVGTFVDKDITTERWLTLPTTLRDLLNLTKSLKATTLRTFLPNSSSLLVTPLPPGAKLAKKYQQMQRVHLLNNDPYCVIDMLLAYDWYRRAPKRYANSPVLPIMFGLKDPPQLSEARQTLTLRSADVAEARALGISTGSAVAEVRRVLVDTANVAIYIASILYPSRVVQLDMNLLANN